MGKRQLLAALAGVAVVLGLPGCAETLSKGWLNTRMVSGSLAEQQDSGGQRQRLSVEGLESWQLWHQNTHKGDGANVMVKAQTTF